jgi:hypothetical protein
LLFLVKANLKTLIFYCEIEFFDKIMNNKNNTKKNKESVNVPQNNPFLNKEETDSNPFK